MKIRLSDFTQSLYYLFNSNSKACWKLSSLNNTEFELKIVCIMEKWVTLIDDNKHFPWWILYCTSIIRLIEEKYCSSLSYRGKMFGNLIYSGELGELVQVQLVEVKYCKNLNYRDNYISRAIWVIYEGWKIVRVLKKKYIRLISE